MNTVVAETPCQPLSTLLTPVTTSLAQRIRSGQSLRILGIASRYPIPPHDAMRTWLDSLSRLGHCTRLLAANDAQGCAEFGPDLVLLIDCDRRACPALPAEMPCVQWQQHSPSATRVSTSDAREENADFYLGLPGERIFRQFDPRRFMPAYPGVDEAYHKPRDLSADERNRFGCDVSVVADNAEDAFTREPMEWLAESGIELKVWGRGWESHSTLGRFALGPVNSPADLAAIHQASRINLHMHSDGAVQPRLLEGLASGGFFLLRACPADVLDRHCRKILGWCDANGVISDLELIHCATREIRQYLNAITPLLQGDPTSHAATAAPGLIETLRSAEQAGYIRSAGTIWGADYDGIAFADRDELIAKVRRFLAAGADRQQISGRMRQTVLERFTYTAVSRRLMDFIAAGVTRAPEVRAAA